MLYFFCLLSTIKQRRFTLQTHSCCLYLWFARTMKLPLIAFCVFAIGVILELKESDAAPRPKSDDDDPDYDGTDNRLGEDDDHDDAYLQRFILNYGKYIIL